MKEEIRVATIALIAAIVGWSSGYSYMKHGPGKDVAEARQDSHEVMAFGRAWIAGLEAGGISLANYGSHTRRNRI